MYAEAIRMFCELHLSTETHTECTCKLKIYVHVASVILNVNKYMCMFVVDNCHKTSIHCVIITTCMAVYSILPISIELSPPNPPMTMSWSS